MTPEQRYDRWERIARLLSEAAMRSTRESRRRTNKLKLYVDARRRYEAAERAVEELPDDSDRKAALLTARQFLEQARKDLTH